MADVSRETSAYREGGIRRTMNKKYMQKALEQAKLSLGSDDVPVGAIVVKDGQIIGTGCNKREANSDPTAHAEIEAIKKAAKKLGSWRLEDAELYVTLEPCPMCTGAIINSRIKRVYFGAYESKSGCCCNDSVINLCELPFNHKPEVYGGICEKECAQLLTEFFKDKRRA